MSLTKKTVKIEMDAQISEHIAFDEVIRSQTATRLGLTNRPNFRQMTVIKNLVDKFFQPLRWELGVPIKVNSFYRSKRLNKMIGGSSRSDHMVRSNVAAIDMDDTYSQKYGVYNRDIFLYIQRNMPYYKLIWEYDDKRTPNGKTSPKWVHVSFGMDPQQNEERNTYYTNGNGYHEFVDEYL